MLARNPSSPMLTDGRLVGDQPPEALRSEPDLPLPVIDRQAVSSPSRPALLRRIFRSARFLPLIPILVLTGGIIGLYFQPPGLQFVMRSLDLRPGAGTSSPIAVPAASPRQGPVIPPGPAEIVGLGKLLPAGDTVTVALPFGAGDARIASLEVAEGEQVEKGVVLARLDNEGGLAAALASAEAMVAARRAELAQVRSATIANRDEARANLSRAQASATNAQSDYERTAQLAERGFSTRATLDQKLAAREQTDREVERAQAALRRYDFADMDQQPDIVVAARNLDRARADLERARRDLEEAVVRAPIAGTVLTIHVRPGERPASQGILSLGDLSRMKAEVEIYQTQIGKVSIGAPVELTADALPQPLQGVVTRVGLEIGRQTLVDADPAANTDARVVTVTVALDRPSTILAQRFTNLQVTARIRIEEPNS